MNVTVSFFPFIKMASSIKELSLTFNLMAIGRTSARSNYNFLLGYKYERFAASLEYAQAYSKNVSNRISAVSFSTSLDVVGPLQVLGRYDYSDIKNPAITFVPNKLDHFVLVGLNTKWFDAHFQVAATFDVNYDPSSRVETSKRFMLATQTLI
ncbi:MAG: hypothetical protein NTY22_02420 [Proteobacteria bacterium]|nr:hypothetical protein [Pseudomonadota bacterium]